MSRAKKKEKIIWDPADPRHWKHFQDMAREAEAKKQGLPPIQLYNLQSDPKETRNVYKDHPEVVKELTGVLRRFVERGRSTPGPVQANTGGTSWPRLPWFERN